MRQLFTWMWRIAGGMGLLLILVTVTPVLGWWTSALSTGWGSADGDTLVVLGSGVIENETLGISSYWRSYYGAVTWRGGHFKRVIVSGKGAAPLMADFLAGHGVPREAIVEENLAESTHENAANVARLLRGVPGRVVLVTSEFHMRRSVRAFRMAGVEVSPLPYPEVRRRLEHWPERWSAMFILAEETVKSVGYFVRGW